MGSMKMALVQMRSEKGDLCSNLSAMDSYLWAAAREGIFYADLHIL